MTYSFPCQDLSLAGKQKGMVKGDNTRSGLLWEVERLLDETDELPQIILMENVPQVIGSKNINDFQLWRKKLESLGYSNYVQLLNAKNYGIPQNRNRCFMVSILGNYYYHFPIKKRLNLKLKDILEDNVSQKYYISEKQLQGMLHTNFISSHFDKVVQDVEKTSATLKARDYKGALCINEGVAIKNNNSKGYEIANKGDGIDISSRMKYHRGTVQKGISQTLKTKCEVGVIDE